MTASGSIGAGTTGNVVEGTTSAPTNPARRHSTTIAHPLSLGNGYAGIYIGDGASDNTVGGTTAGARNVISGNATNGVEITTPLARAAMWSRETTSAPTIRHHGI